MITDKWNNLMFTLATVIMEFHSSFSVSKEIGFDKVCELTAATPEKVEERWCKMVLQLSHIINNWKKCGQGDGGIINESMDDDA